MGRLQDVNGRLLLPALDKAHGLSLFGWAKRQRGRLGSFLCSRNEDQPSLLAERGTRNGKDQPSLLAERGTRKQSHL